VLQSPRLLTHIKALNIKLETGKFYSMSLNISNLFFAAKNSDLLVKSVWHGSGLDCDQFLESEKLSLLLKLRP